MSLSQIEKFMRFRAISCIHNIQASLPSGTQGGV